MPQNTQIQNVHKNAERKALIEAWIDEKIFTYFFRKVLAGERGPRQALICYFFEEFHKACVLNGIAPEFDFGNEERVWEVLKKLNFCSIPAVSDLNPKPTKRGKKPKEIE